MKYSLFLFALVFSLNTYGQNETRNSASTHADAYNGTKKKTVTSLKSCWGIPFGTSRDSVLLVSKNKSGKQPLTSFDHDVIIFEDIKFGSFFAEEIKLLFINNVFYSAKIRFKPGTPQDLYDLYQALKSDISDKYFPPQNDIEIYKSPFSKDDANKYVPITTGHATIGARWDFKADDTAPGNGNIWCGINRW